MSYLNYYAIWMYFWFRLPVCTRASLHACLCGSVSYCQHLFSEVFTQCHIPKVVKLSPLRYTVKKKKPTGIPVSLDTPQISTLRYNTAPKSGNKMSTEWYGFVSVFASLYPLFFFLACFSFFFPTSSFSVPADSPAVDSRHIPQSVSLLIPGPDLKGSLKDESLYTVPDFVK